MEIRTEFRVVRGGSRGDYGDGEGLPILVDNVLMDGRQRQEDLDNGIDVEKDPFGFDLLLGGWDGRFGSAAQWCSCSRNHGGTSVIQWPGILQMTLRLESTE